MKRTAIILILGLVGCLSACAGGAPEQPWLTDLPKALTQAKAEKKLALLDFTGSDWCPGCIDLHKKVLSSKRFQEYASTNLVLVLVDFPNKKPQSDELKKTNKELADKFGVDGFPTVILLDASGKQLGKIEGYGSETPKEYIAKLESAKVKP